MKASESTQGKIPASPSISNILRALNHPVRRGIMRQLNESGVTFSPAELADELHKPVNKTSYHTMVLKKAGMIRLVRKGYTRGAIQHFYASNVAEDKRVKTILAESQAEDG
ncbi:MAG TPA: helix-turn-helix domain-containing protein [Solirubrobacterales bacterium]